MYTYYHWCMYETFDGLTLIISDINVVQSDIDILSLYVNSLYVNYNSQITVQLIKTGESFISCRYSLYKTEKEAIIFAIKTLRKSITLLDDANVAPPINPKVWVNKAKSKLDLFFVMYQSIYPEVFI